jgi:membrane protease YdiL (CAAX protease family)
MKATGIFFLYLLVCLVLAALLTYPLLAPGWIELAPHRVMGRLAQVFILIGLWPFLKAMGLDNRAVLGYGATRPDFLGAVWRGWLLGLAILTALALVELMLGVRILESVSAGWMSALLKKAAQALIGGLLIGLLEETFFRGALFAVIRRRGGVAAAVVWTAVLYALVHFMKPGALPAGVALDWAGAWRMFAGVFTDAFQWKNLDSMTALFLAGVFLALVRGRTGHIGWCIGLHAGWVFVIQVTRQLTDGNAASPYSFLVGTYDGMIGWLAAAWMGALVLALAVLDASRRRRPKSPALAHKRDGARTG